MTCWYPGGVGAKVVAGSEGVIIPIPAYDVVVARRNWGSEAVAGDRHLFSQALSAATKPGFGLMHGRHHFTRACA